MRGNSEDRLSDALVTAAAWADVHRRLVFGAFVALVLVIAGGWYYVDYRSQVTERAGAELERLRLQAGSVPEATLREDLAAFVSRFGGTPYEGEARVMLAELQRNADSAQAAIRTLRPVADLSSGAPVAFRAAFMIGAAEEDSGNPGDAIQWYRRIASAAPFDFLRQEAQSEEARVLAQTGDLEGARKLLAGLVEETTQGEATSPYAERLGEVQAMLATGMRPTPPPADLNRAPPAGAGDVGQEPAEAPAADTAAAPGS